MEDRSDETCPTDAVAYGVHAKTDRWMTIGLSLLGMVLTFFLIRDALMSDETEVADWIIWLAGAYLQGLFFTVLALSVTGRLRIHAAHLDSKAI